MKHLFLMVSLISGFAFSQNLEFDYYLKYKSSRIKPSEMKFEDAQIYINSKDPSYTMRSRIVGNQKRVDIENFKTRFWYKFDVEQREGLSDVYYYDYARKFIDMDEKDKHFVSKVNVEKTGENTYFIKTFKKGKKPNFEIRLELEKAEDDLLFMDIPDMSRDISMKILSELKNKLGEEKFVIKKVEYDYKAGFVFVSELLKIEKVSKRVNLPAEIHERAKMQFSASERQK